MNPNDFQENRTMSQSFISRVVMPIALACGLVSAGFSSAAFAVDFPVKSITVIVPHTPGGTSDILARTLAAEASKILKQQIVVENKSGANGTIAAKQVASAPPDGYMLLLATASTHGINPSLYTSLPYDAVRDFKPVTLLATVPNVLVVGKALKDKVSNLQELLAYIKSQGDKANMGSSGAGTPGHLAGEMMKSATGVQFTHVPYKGGNPAQADLVGGQVDFMFTTIPGAIALIHAGNLRALAVTSPQRSPALPDVPTMAEQGLPGFQALSWHGILAPAETPDAIVAILNNAFTQALQSPEVTQRLAKEGAAAADLNTEAFREFIAKEIKNWSQAVKSSGATPN
jgi:tripartite-type tricarboxylate transporter receptor subunit TctC